MKKIFIITLLLISMMVSTAFASVEASYWESMKSMYEWDYMGGDSEIDLVIAVPNINAHYNLKMKSQSNLKEFITFMELEVLDMLGANEIPTIRLYTQGSDLYINRDAVMALLESFGLNDMLEIKEDYLLLKSSQSNIQMNANFLQEMIGFLEEMDLGIELGMIKEGNTYKLSLSSDEILDLLAAYLKHFLTNMDNLPEGILPEEFSLTEEDKQVALDQYHNMIMPQIQMLKGLVMGSYYNQVSVFEEDSYYEEAELFITSPMMEDINIKMNIVSNTNKLSTSNINLPTSVLIITDEEFTNLLMSRFIPTGIHDTQKSLVYLIDLKGNYTKFGNEVVEDGKIDVTVKDGRTYITKEIALELFGVEFIDTQESLIWIRELNGFGYFVDWNSSKQRIEIYR